MMTYPDRCSASTFFFNDTATTEIYTLSLHDALPISVRPADAGQDRPAQGGLRARADRRRRAQAGGTAVTETRRLTGRLHVGLPPAEAFRLFTARGEQDWAHGWQPHFPAPAPDDSEPGIVFETSAHGQHTVWVVTERE